jgi:hypothetical protein
LTAFIGYIGLKWVDYLSDHTTNTVVSFSFILPFIPPLELRDIGNSEIQTIIRQKITGRSGIYAFVNMINGNSYVGSAFPGRLYIRFRNHLYQPTYGSK